MGGPLLPMQQNNKIIHYFLEGDLGYDYRDSWVKHAPGWEIVHWNASNIPVSDQLEKHVANKKWSVVSDFVRRWSIYEFGGIYLDFDVELIKPMDEVLDLNFVCIEAYPVFANAAVTGGFKGNSFHKRLLDDYYKVLNGGFSFGVSLEVSVGPYVITDYIKQLKGVNLGEQDVNEIVSYGDFVTLPKDYFFPYNWNEEFKGVTERTIGIHHWKKGWE